MKSIDVTELATQTLNKIKTKKKPGRPVGRDNSKTYKRISVSVNEAEYDQIKEDADEFAGGNVSLYIKMLLKYKNIKADALKDLLE